MKIIYRFLKRILHDRPIYTSITLTGFIIGITASLLIYFWIRNELSYEKFHPDYRRIYRVLTLSRQGNRIVNSAGNYRPVVKTLEADYPQIEYATYITYHSQDVPLQAGEQSEKIEARGGWVSVNFFNVFSGFEFVEGSAGHAFDDPSGIVITEELKNKLFGEEKALGKTIINNLFAGYGEVYKVGAVIRIPLQSHIGFDYMVSEKYGRYAYLSDNWGDKAHTSVYIKLSKGAGIDKDFLSRITGHIGRYSNRTDKLIFQPLADIHLYSDYESFLYDKNISSYKYVFIFAGLALLIIVMASLNFSILSVARASERQTEIGIKKASGAGKFRIAAQFMGESFVMTFLATTIATILAIILLPWISRVSGQSLEFDLSPGLILSLIVFMLFVGVLAGIYPSLYLSSFSPTGIFRGVHRNGAGSGLVNLLVTAQFMIAVFFLAATTLFIKQMNYIRNKDLGIAKENIVVVPTGLWYGSQPFKDELMKNPAILGVSGSSFAPMSISFEMSLPFVQDGNVDTLQTNILWADENFAATYKLGITKGQFYQYTYDDYWNEGEGNKTESNIAKEYAISIPVVINETAEKILGYDDPVGKRLGDNYVITGVVKDFHYRPLRFPIGPLVITNNPEAIGTMNISITRENKEQTLDFIGETYKKFRDSRDLSFTWFEDMMANEYLAETRLRNMTMVFAGLAMIIAVMGMLGMAFFTCDRRTKEIGIRKANGAGIFEIVILLNKDYVKWVIVAAFIATPVSWYLLHNWLRNFAYKTGLSWWIFALAGFLALGIALLTVSWQSWRWLHGTRWRR